MIVRTHLSVALSCLLLGTASLAAGCRSYAQSFAPGLEKDAHPFAFQAASLSYSFMNGETVQWLARLDEVEKDVVPLLAKVRDSGFLLRIAIEERAANVTYYDVRLLLRPPVDHELSKLTALSSPEGEISIQHPEVQKALGIDVTQAQAAEFGVAKFINLLTQLNASNDTLQRHAFALLVVREKARRGERVDWFDGTREPEETAKDVDIALSVVAGHHADEARRRAEIVATVALLQAYAAPDALSAISEQLEESRRHAREWQATHHQPTTEEFGVRMRELKLPTPQAMLEKLDESGYIAASLKLAQSIAAGDPRMTLEGLQALAPEDPSISAALNGLKAAIDGDVGKTIEAVATLTGREADVETVKARLSRFEDYANAAGSPGSMIGKVKGSIDGVKGSVDEVKDSVGEVRRAPP